MLLFKIYYVLMFFVSCTVINSIPQLKTDNFYIRQGGNWLLSRESIKMYF